MIKSFFLSLIVLLALTQIALAQGKYTLFGDVKIDDSKVQGQARFSINLILYTEAGAVVGRQSIMTGSRYRFVGIRTGVYDLVIQIDSNEVARIRTIVGGSIETEYRQDLDLELQSNRAAVRSKPGTISAADLYERAADNQSLFNKARSAMIKQKYGDAAVLLQQLLAASLFRPAAL